MKNLNRCIFIFNKMLQKKLAVLRLILLFMSESFRGKTNELFCLKKALNLTHENFNKKNFWLQFSF